MFRSRGGQTKSPFPISQPGGDSESYDDFIQRLQTLIEGDDIDAFFEAIDSASPRWQRKPEFMLIKALGWLQAGDRDEARKVLDEMERTQPRFGPLYFYKAALFMEDAFPAHVLRVLEKIHALGSMDSESEAEMGKMENISRQMIKDSADKLHVSYEKMEKASWYHEAAQEKMTAGQWVSAEQMAREAIRQIQHWTSPRNNRSYILYFMGRVQDATAEAQAVLMQHPDNLYALKNLTLFHVGFDEYEKAREFSGRMLACLESLPTYDNQVDVAISALALAEDDDNLWTLAQKYLKSDPEDLFETSWYALGVAAIRKGRLKDAKTLLEKAEDFIDPSNSLVVEVRKALKAGKSLSANPSHHTLGFLLPPAIIKELIDIMGNYLQVEQLPRHLQKKLDEFIQKRPFVINGLFRLLLEQDAAAAIPGMLVQFNKPEIDARLMAFALSDTGSSQLRLNVLSALSQIGRELPPNPIRFWSEERGEWSDVEFNAQMLSDDLDLNISPQASVWAQKAYSAKSEQEKVACWRKAVEIDPQSGYAVHMLGILLIQMGQKEEGFKLAKHAIEVDPNYMFAYANLALFEAQAETPNVELALEYLGKVSKARVITSQTAFIMHFALMILAFERDDFNSARKEYEIAFDLRPDDPMLEDWDTRLKFGEVFAGGWLAEWQETSRQRSHNKAIRTKLEDDSSVSITLNSLTRDALGTVARVWGLTSYGKKAELINNIVDRMRDSAGVEAVWGTLNETEHNVLRWVLENNSARAWKDFTEKYGDDAGESPHWNYHEPASVIGRLRQSGFLAIGTLNGKQVVFIPVEIRSLLKSLIKI